MSFFMFLIMLKIYSVWKKRRNELNHNYAKKRSIDNQNCEQFILESMVQNIGITHQITDVIEQIMSILPQQVSEIDNVSRMKLLFANLKN